jgi:hypothetical protein
MKTRVLYVTEQQLVKAINKTIEGLDSDDLAKLAKHILGGMITYDEADEKYEVIPDETYGGAFD